MGHQYRSLRITPLPALPGRVPVAPGSTRVGVEPFFRLHVDQTERNLPELFAVVLLSTRRAVLNRADRRLPTLGTRRGVRGHLRLDPRPFQGEEGEEKHEEHPQNEPAHVLLPQTFHDSSFI